jgi:probable F420-dependent oxidoreductase
MMRLSISLADLAPEREADRFVDVARAAEGLGFDGVFAPHHVLRALDHYWLDPIVLLAAIAGATKRIALGTTVIVLPYYQPLIIAHQLATLDRLSGGRVIVGIGTGWNEQEFASLGVDMAERGARTDEALRLIRAVWGGGPAAFAGEFSTLVDAELGVAPLGGGPRVWIGGHGERPLRRAARYGDGWHGFDAAPAFVREVRDRLANLAVVEGRDPAAIELTTTWPLQLPDVNSRRQATERAARELSELAAAGVAECVLRLDGPADRLIEAMGWVAAEVAPLSA